MQPSKFFWRLPLTGQTQVWMVPLSSCVILFKHTASLKSVSIPHDLLQLLSGTGFGDGCQHDAHELLLWILQRWHHETLGHHVIVLEQDVLSSTQMVDVETTLDDVSAVMKVFQGLVSVATTCPECQHTQKRYTPALNVTLYPDPHKVTSTERSCGKKGSHCKLFGTWSAQIA